MWVWRLLSRLGTACETTPVEDNDGGGGTGGVGGAPTCDAPEPAHAGTNHAVDGITVTYIDQTGAPAQGVKTTVCGTDQCSMLVDSDASGVATVDEPGEYTFMNTSFNSGHDGHDYAKIGRLIPEMAGVIDFGTVRVIRMPGFAMGVALDPGAVARKRRVAGHPG